MGKKEIREDTSFVKEMQDIKRLLILALLRSSASQTEIATALNVNKSTISRMKIIKDSQT
jgi:IS30 family transposase